MSHDIDGSQSSQPLSPEESQSIPLPIGKPSPVESGERDEKTQAEPMFTLQSVGQPVQKVSYKVQIVLKPVGGEVPALEKQKYKLDGTKAIVEVERFLKKKLSLDDKMLYLFCGQGFSPTPDQVLQDLYDCFHIGEELVISYGVQEVWG